MSDLTLIEKYSSDLRRAKKRLEEAQKLVKQLEGILNDIQMRNVPKNRNEGK